MAEDPIPVARAKRSRARSTDSAESYHDEEETPPARKKSKTAGKKTPSRKPVGRSSPVKRRTPAADPEAETFSIEVVSSTASVPVVRTNEEALLAAGVVRVAVCQIRHVPRLRRAAAGDSRSNRRSACVARIVEGGGRAPGERISFFPTADVSSRVASRQTGNANPIAEEGADGLLRRLGLQVSLRAHPVRSCSDPL